MCFHFNFVKCCFIELSEKPPQVSVKLFFLACNFKSHIKQVKESQARQAGEGTTAYICYNKLLPERICFADIPCL